MGGLVLPLMFSLSLVIGLEDLEEEEELAILVNGSADEPIISFSHENITLTTFYKK